MKRINLLFIFFFFFLAITKGQNSNDYSPVVSKGLLPKEFSMSVATKYSLLETKNNSVGQNNLFLQQSNCEIEYLIHSQWVVYDSAMNHYLEKIADILLKDEPTFRQTLKFYLLKSPNVNSFSFYEGSIFISMGTFAYLQTEAELAFVVAREIAHVKAAHTFDRYIDVGNIREINKKKEVLYPIKEYDQYINLNLLKKCRYSSEDEQFADKKGLELLLKTAYKPNACIDMINHLELSDLPYQNIPFETAFLQANGIVFPQNYFLIPTVDTFKQHKIMIDSIPNPLNLKERIDLLKKEINLTSHHANEAFLVSQNRFDSLQIISRLELPQLFLHQGNYIKAFYFAYLLHNQYPNSLYVEKYIAKSLYGLETHFDKINYYPNVEGGIQQANAFLFHLNKKELYLLTLNYIWQLKQKNATDVEVNLLWKAISDSYIVQNDMSFHHSFDLHVQDTNAWSNELLKSCLAAEECKKVFEQKIVVETPKQLKKRIYHEVNGFQTHGDLAIKSEKALKLGIKKAMIVNPVYKKFNIRKEGEGLQLIGTEIAQKQWMESMYKTAKKAKIQIEVLETQNLKTDEIEKYNEINLLEEWLYEQINSEKTPFSGTQQAKVNELAKKYDTNYFVWMGVVDAAVPKDHKRSFGFIYNRGAYVLPQFWIPTIYQIIKPDNVTLLYVIVYDITTGKSQVIKKNIYYRKTSPLILDVQLYDTFLQMRKKANKKITSTK